MPRLTQAIHGGPCAAPDNEFLAAKAQLEFQLRTAQVVSDQAACEAAWTQLAILCRSNGREAEAASFQQQALKLAFAHFGVETSRFLTCHLSNRANEAITSGDWQFAERLLLAALAIDRQQADLAAEGADWGSLGIVAALQGNFDLAIERLCRALVIHQKLQDDDAIGIDLRHLAEIALVQGDLDRADGLVDRAIGHLRVNGVEELCGPAETTWREVKARRRLTSFDPRRN